MIKIINFQDFCDSFSDTYKNNFTYEGKKALFEYLELLEDGTGEQIELDPIALCCDYTEYVSGLQWAEETGDVKDFTNEDDALDYLKDKTQVIEFDGGIIIQNF